MGTYPHSTNTTHRMIGVWEFQWSHTEIEYTSIDISQTFPVQMLDIYNYTQLDWLAVCGHMQV